jgi:transcriptional regulator with XRE-family HTH domain
MSSDTSRVAPPGAGFEQDLHRSIGRAIRRRRRLVEMTQQKLAARCGVSFQQIQKYEAGEASIYAARLWAIAEALGVSVAYFFEGSRIGSASAAG